MLKPWFPWAGAGLLSPIILLTAHTCACTHTHISPPPAYLKYQQIFFHKFKYKGHKFRFTSDTCPAAPRASLQTPASAPGQTRDSTGPEASLERGARLTPSEGAIQPQKQHKLGLPASGQLQSPWGPVCPAAPAPPRCACRCSECC